MLDHDLIALITQDLRHPLDHRDAAVLSAGAADAHRQVALALPDVPLGDQTDDVRVMVQYGKRPSRLST